MTATRGIYLDNNATTEVEEEVVEAIVAALREGWGNPSSLHAFGERAARVVEGARGEVARLVNARSPEEVVFTSGGTESINAALAAALAARPGGRVLTSATEHAAVLRPLEEHAARGGEVERVGVDREGRIDLDRLLDRLDASCALVTLHYANNETGAALEDDEVRRVAERAAGQRVPFHLDAVQAPGKLAVDVRALGCTLLSLSAHKFHGPKGAGALWLARDALGGAPFRALVAGGPQESGRRGGTPNVPGIAGLGRAAALARAHVADEAARRRVRELRDRLEAGLAAALPGLSVHAAGGRRLDNTSSVHVPGVDGELLLASLAAEGLAVSSGAACSARTRGPSPVLLAMGLDEEEASSTLRFSPSRRTRPEEVESAVQIVARVVGELAPLAS